MIINGADREVDSSKVRAGTLEKITYPTGGYTFFQFESNTLKTNEPLLQRNSLSVLCNAGPAWGVNTCRKESAPTVINSVDGYVKVNVSLVITPGNYARVTLINTGTGVETVLSQGNYLLPVSSGTYKLVAESSHEEPVTGNDQASGTISWDVNVGTTKSKLGPGLRIKRIISNDGIAGSQSTVTKYIYTTFTDNTESSGGLQGNIPTYTYNFQVVNSAIIPPTTKNYLVRASNSQADLGNGGAVAYTNIKKLIGENGENGYVNSYYTYLASIGSAGYPFPPVMSNSHKTGLLTKQLTFTSSGKLLKDVSNTYTYRTDYNLSLAPTFIVGYLKRNETDNGGTTIDFQNNTFVTNYQNYTSDWFYLSSTSTITYDQNNTNSYTEKVDYAYQNPVHIQPTQISTSLETTAGVVRQLVTTLKYPNDYTLTGTLSGTAAVIKNMSDKNMINVPIEQLKSSVKGSDKRMIGGDLSTFRLNGSWIARDKDFQVKFTNSSVYQDLVSVTPSTINTSGQFIYDSHYEQLNSYNRYDSGNSLLELADQKTTQSLICEPNTKNVWASVINSAYTGIAYSSFEHDATLPSTFTNWNYNVANLISTAYFNGKRSYNLNGAGISNVQTLVSSQTYKVSLWRRVGSGSTLTFTAGGTVRTATVGVQRNGWEYVELVFTSATGLSISGNYIIDELRLYPVNARMTTYVHKNGAGITSQCNENNQNTFFEYDEFNRLKLVRDQDGNILKKDEYQYQYGVN
jgi:hypothetical protein